MNIFADIRVPVASVLIMTAAVLLLVVCPESELNAREQQEETTLQALFRQANHAYSQGEYENAMEGYRDLLKRSGPSAGLNYNAGCAALKAGELGWAVVYFSRAARLDPHDPDIRTNLEFVRELTRPDDQQEDTGNVVLSYLAGLVFTLSTYELSLLQLGLLLFFTLGAVLFASGVSGRLRRGALIITSVGLLLLLINSAMLAAHIYRFTQITEAVVVQNNAEALSGPGEDNTRVLVIPEGTVVRVRENRGDWALVSLPSGRSGWLKTSLVEDI